MHALIALTLFALAQDYEEPSKATLAYLERRSEIVAPSYGLSRVRALIKAIKPSATSDDLVLPEAQWAKLSKAEKFTYCMLHGEVFTQNCDAMPPIKDSEKKLFADFPGPFSDETVWSARQMKFLHDARGTVLSLTRETMSARGRTGANLKATIEEVNGWELIPDLVKLYKRDRKDHDILTLLNKLMLMGKYPAFMNSQSYTKLYGPDANYQSFLEANAANQDLVISRATAYCASKRK